MPKQPWKPAIATSKMNGMANASNCYLGYTKHAKDRISERNLIISDVLYVLRNGFVYEEALEESTIKGFYKYSIEGQSPNSGARSLKVIAIPDEQGPQIKIVTIMWRDEK